MKWVLRNWLAVTSFASVCLTGGMLFSDVSTMQKQVDKINETKPQVLESKIEDQEQERSADQQFLAQQLAEIHADLKQLNGDVSFIKGRIENIGGRE